MISKNDNKTIFRVIYKIWSKNIYKIYIGQTLNEHSRFSLYNTLYKKYIEGKGKFKPIFEIFQAGDVECLVLERRECLKSEIEVLETQYIYQYHGLCVNKYKLKYLDDTQKDEHIRMCQTRNAKNYYLRNKDSILEAKRIEYQELKILKITDLQKIVSLLKDKEELQAILLNLIESKPNLLQRTLESII